ncbi:hypothetical protein [Noviherbaspirillum sp.]|uniref:hypothetical protein n=1 Tax=Noviherbaspirillum sp. TaxID=1926288 RepID=UPI002D636A75|nr:hypothetical protein [Noviherbaspirillum sp.]HZW20755.1 hypothetical protein [Noviherbaspirillum sp.]
MHHPQLFIRATVPAKQVLAEIQWHTDCFDSARAFPASICSQIPAKTGPERAEAVESEGRQRYAVGEILETGKHVSAVPGLIQGSADIDIFLGALP